VEHKKVVYVFAFIVVATILLIFIKPKDEGKPYSPYFVALNEELKKNSTGTPVLVIDLDLLDKNIDTLKHFIQAPKTYRVVDKSLPSLGLIEYIFQKTGTKKVMCFHQPFLNLWAKQKPDVDLLLGKPMPIDAVATFYNNLPDSSTFNPAKQIQWLIDSEARLKQYQVFAQQNNLQLQLNVEIDVGLHRGGLNDTAQLKSLLKVIEKDAAHLSFTGFMGYDAHIPEVFPPLGTQDAALKKAQEIYASFIHSGRQNFPHVFTKKLCFNGAGSKTYQLYEKDTLLNDVSAGSGLLKPTDFDIPNLENHQPAFFIATPVLKKSSGIKIPFLEFLSPLMEWWNPNLSTTYFIYGGRWKAKHYEPRGLRANALYGFSSNQEIVNGSNKTSLKVDDYIFLRPTQSEAVMLEFGDIVLLRNGKLAGKWHVFAVQ